MIFWKRREPPSAANRCAASREDFVETLRLLGAQLSIPHRTHKGTVPYDVQPVLLSCSRNMWERVFGQPENLKCYYVPSKQRFFHTWEHHWVGGRVMCVGCLFEQSLGKGWVVANRLFFFESESSRRNETPEPQASAHTCGDFQGLPAEAACQMGPAARLDSVGPNSHRGRTRHETET